MLDRPKLIDNFLSENVYRELKALVQDAPLKYGAKSNSATDPWGHLSWKPLHDKTENLADLTVDERFDLFRDAWRVTERTLGQVVPVRVYANSYTYGMDGYFHTDSRRAGDLTVIIFICDKWEHDWAGELAVLSYDEKIYWSFEPHPNRAVIVPSNMRHCARAVSRMCPQARTTFMFKTRPLRAGMFEALSRWLVKHNALIPNHKDGSLHDHLMRVFEILREKGCDMDLCVAGGLHSVYGTNIFKEAIIVKDDVGRKLVRDNWGPKVEELVFGFSNMINRPACFNDLAVRFSSQLIHDLTVIECANLLDQGSLNNWPNLVGFWGSYAP